MTQLLPVLVVDDDEDVRVAISTVLRDDGFEVVTQESGGEALEYLYGGGHPGVILLDMMMPNVNGEEFRRRQLDDARLSRIPVVAVSASPITESDASRLQLTHRLRKPFDIDDLLTVVRRLYGRT